MSSNVVNQVSYLRTSRLFPEDPKELTLEINKTYVDIANAVNSSIDGIFPVNQPAITRESWFLTQNVKQQSLRQVFTFTTFTSITHGIKVIDTNQFLRGYGSYTDGTNAYGLIFGTNNAIAGQAVFYITPTQIIFNAAGAPVPTKGKLVIEWLSQP